MNEYRFLPVTAETKTAAYDLLQENNLPTADLEDKKNLFILVNNQQVIGTGGLEIFEDCALVRSVSVRSRERKRGLGNLITRELELVCKKNGIEILFLLTTSAESFFEKQGYISVSRDEIPDSIKSTAQYKGLCAASASVMKKILR